MEIIELSNKLKDTGIAACLLQEHNLPNCLILYESIYKKFK